MAIQLAEVQGFTPWSDIQYQHCLVPASLQYFESLLICGVVVIQLGGRVVKLIGLLAYFKTASVYSSTRLCPS